MLQCHLTFLSIVSNFQKILDVAFSEKSVTIPPTVAFRLEFSKKS